METLRLAWRVFWLWYRRPAHERRHAELLKRINTLERELFPEWFPNPAAAYKAAVWKDTLYPRVEDFVFEPGARWLVTDPSQVQYIPARPIPAAVSASASYNSPIILLNH